jgi:tripartite-type tricarboxylate transporter receptor subunit TctC
LVKDAWSGSAYRGGGDLDDLRIEARGSAVSRSSASLRRRSISNPSDSVRRSVPAGGTADYVARLIAQPLTQTLGQQVLVDNRPGGDGAVAGTIVMKAAPDGHTIFFGTNSRCRRCRHCTSAPLRPHFGFHADQPHRTLTFFLFETPNVPARTVSELITYVRANPGKLNYGTGNTSAIVAMAQFKALAGLELTHVPYKGDAPTTADMLGGSIQLAFMTPVPGLAYVKEGRLRLLAVLLPQRSALAPDVPTIAEAGMPGVSITPWAGLFALRRCQAQWSSVFRESCMRCFHAQTFGSSSAGRGSKRKRPHPRRWAATTRISCRRGSV